MLHLIVATLLTGKGPTGVETHFNQILDAAQAHQLDTVLVTPHGGFSIERKLSNAVARLLRLINVEWSIIWSRWTSYHRIIRRLKSVATSADQTPTTIYAQDPLSTKAALAVRARLGCRVIAVVHFNISEAQEMLEKGLAKQDGPLWHYLMATEAQTLKHVDHLIFVSDFMRQIVTTRLPDLDQVPQSVIPNFPADYTSGEEMAGESGDIVAIGTLEPRKNQQFLLHVLSICKQRGKHYSLSLIGDGPDRKKLEKLAQQLGIADQIRFLGFQSRAAGYLSTHKVLAHSSLMESQGIVLLEALAFGRPIVAAPVGGIPEVFTDGVEGRYWDLNDINKSAEILMALLEDNETRMRMCDAARVSFGVRFDRACVAGRWMAVLTGAAA